jgi:hypothetical protein
MSTTTTKKKKKKTKKTTKTTNRRTTEMQSATLNKITLGTLGLFLTGAIGFGIHQTDQATSWQQEAVGWQAVAAQTNTVSVEVSAQNKLLVRKFNKLARSTSATTGAPTAAITVSAAETPEPVAVAQPAPATAPTSQAS